MIFAFLQCALLISLYASGIISSIFVERSEYPFKQKDLARVLGEGRHRLYTSNSYDVRLFESVFRQLAFGQIAYSGSMMKLAPLKIRHTLNSTQAFRAFQSSIHRSY